MRKFNTFTERLSLHNKQSFSATLGLMIKAVIFDFFGVITTDALSEIVIKLRENDTEKADRIVGLVHAASKGSLDADASRTAVAAELGLTREEYRNTMRDDEKRNVPLLRYIKELKGNFKTALLSNVISGGLEARFPNGELSEYFDVVVASGDIGFAKPESQAYRIIADRLAVRLDECIFIDDGQDNCDGAKAVGMQAVLYRTFEQMKYDLTLLGVKV